MPFNGSGTFNRVMNWMNDAAAAIKIKADRHDQNDDDIAAGLSNCLTKDGQTLPTADIPMNGKKLVNLGAPTVGSDAVTKTYADTKAPLASPALTGVPTAPTAAPGTNSTQLATTAFAADADALKAPLDSPTFTGKVRLPQGTAASAPLNLSYALAEPTAPVDGDIWPVGSAGFRHRIAGVTYTFGRLEAAQTWSGAQTFLNQINIQGASAAVFLNDTDGNDFWLHANGNNFYVLCDRTGDGNWDVPHPLLLDSINNTGLLFNNTIWHAGNDGPGSGLNADLLDGWNTAFSTGTPSTVAVRDGNGDIFGRLFRSEYAGANATVAYFTGMNALGVGADNFIRPISAANAAAQIANLISPSGAWGGGGTPNTWILNSSGKALLFRFNGGTGTWNMLWSPDAGASQLTAASGLSANGGIFWVPPGWYYRLGTTATGYTITAFQ